VDKREFASIEWSKKLGHLFQDAEWWWKRGKIVKRDLRFKYQKRGIYKPAITIRMALERLPIELDIHGMLYHLSIERDSVYYVGYICGRSNMQHLQSKESLPNALCAMIEKLEVDDGI